MKITLTLFDRLYSDSNVTLSSTGNVLDSEGSIIGRWEIDQ